MNYNSIGTKPAKNKDIKNALIFIITVAFLFSIALLLK